MNRKNNLSPHTLKSILVASQDIIRYAKRYHIYRTPTRQPSQEIQSIYQQAKIAETQQRNLTKAAFLYADAACQGIRLDSCIKDFASIVHQMGQTFEAVQFLLEVRPYYHGDFKKFDRLLNTLQRQLKPSKKHECKSLLFELPSQSFAQKSILDQMFQNTNRIKSCKFFRSLDFLIECIKGKWMVLEFQSFSAAKKTLQKFNHQSWFMFNKFWLREDSIICQAKDGWQDFEEGLVINDEILREGLFEKYQTYKWDQVSNDRQFLNYLSLRLIEEDLHFRSLKEAEVKTY